MNTTNTKVLPKQPYFVMATSKYYKSVILQYGISHFYSFRLEKNKEHTMLAIPDGCIDFLFRCDDNHPEAKICGTVLTPTITFSQEASYYFGVRFLPGKVPEICGIPMADVISAEIPLNELIQDKDLIEKITSSQDFKYQQKTFMDAYLHYYILHTSSPKQNIREFLIQQMISSAGNVHIRDLATQTGYTERYINKVFKEYYGITPKMFCKMMRFQYLLDNLNMDIPQTDFAELSQITGYYDQSHMMKDFKKFTQTTPKKYLSSLKNEKYDDRLILTK